MTLRRNQEDRIDTLIAEAADRRRDAGVSAASWVFDGNTSNRTYARILRLIKDGGPELYDIVQEPSWLSGEYGGESISELLGDLLDELRELPNGEDAEDDLLTAYETAASEAFWAEVEREARRGVT